MAFPLRDWFLKRCSALGDRADMCKRIFVTALRIIHQCESCQVGRKMS